MAHATPDWRLRRTVIINNEEIIKFTGSNHQLEKLKDDYESIGYSVRIIDYNSFEKTHELLFKGFFSVSGIYDRLARDYENFCQLQSAKLFGSSYEYVEPVWNWNNGNSQENLIDSIYEQMNRPGGQLIILEAAAGYGKTCTSYELIKKIAENKESDYAPIFTELSKNRKAALFRYVLLDEIDCKFTTLSSELVISEIRNGKVPLIIDGFDELISRSNRNMSERQEVSEDDSQTMLDTIAELFEEGCATKVVLTSRKSAIFTGDIFEAWANKHLSGCNVTRVSINEPTIADWIGHEKANYLQNRRIPFASIVNPILLAFMRSMSMDKFKEKCNDVENVISYYFDSLLERERERQSCEYDWKGEKYREGIFHEGKLQKGIEYNWLIKVEDGEYTKYFQCGKQLNLTMMIEEEIEYEGQEKYFISDFKVDGDIECEMNRRPLTYK